MARDLVFVLGMGIYVTGFCKDFLCLPRPRSPPFAQNHHAVPHGPRIWLALVALAGQCHGCHFGVDCEIVELRSDLGFALWLALMVLLAVYYSRL